jgi:peptidoglycan/LPS O-acetylase OafA/YrhL
MTGSISHERFRAQRFFGCLDGLRAISILAVVWHHSGESVTGIPLLARGFLGVDLFFVISGFLIPTLLLRERSAHGYFSLAGFYWRRLLRIFPPYYLTLAIYAVVFMWIKPASSSGSTYWEELPYYLTYTSNWVDAKVYGISWSLACEEQFYLLLPPLLIILRGKWILAFGLVFLTANQMVNFGLVDGLLEELIPGAESLAVLQATFTPIALGVFLAFALHSRRGYDILRRALAGPRCAILAAALTLAVASIPNPDISGSHRLVLHACMVALVGSSVIREDNGLRRLLTIGAIRRLGKLSYGVYLYHKIGLDLSMRFMNALGIDLVIVCAALTGSLSWVMAEFSFRLMESRLLRLRRFVGVQGRSGDSGTQ